jgi:ADP-ribosylglycohydrolase
MGDLGKLDRWRGALGGMFVGDALAMPVHWYSNAAIGRNQVTSTT